MRRLGQRRDNDTGLSPVFYKFVVPTDSVTYYITYYIIYVL
jgi:hypothetical protein